MSRLMMSNGESSSVSKSGVYDNWEKLVDGVIDREKLRRLALCDSFSTTTSSFSRLDSTASSTINYDAPTNWSGTLAKPIQLTYQVIIAADVAASFKQECAGLKSQAEKLATLLHQAAQASDVLCEQPTHRIINETERVLAKALSLVLKCRGNGLMNRVLVISPASAFRKMSYLLENSIRDVSWLLRVSASSSDDNEYLGLPPLARNEPILCLIWEQIAILYSGNIDDRGDAASSLVSLAGDSNRYGKLIIEEGGVGPLLKLVKEGKVEGQENAAKAIGLLGKDPESVEHIIHAGVCDVFVEILEEGPAKLQAVVAWAVSELAANYPNCQNLFARLGIITLLTSHLAFETVQENAGIRGDNNRAGAMEEPDTKLHLKAMVARALRYLARQNDAICRTIAESQALLCFAILLERGPVEVRWNSAMALMEITAVAETNLELRRSAFESSSPEYKAIVNQLFRIIEEDDPDDLLIPCIRAIGNLALIYRATETRMINPLVRLLDEQTSGVSRVACIALTKFACTYNYLHLDHTTAIIGAGGVRQLVQLVYFDDISSALVLLCYIALHAPDSRELVEAGVLSALEWASKQSNSIEDLEKYCNDNLAHLMQWEDIKGLLRSAKGILELYNSRNSRGWSYQYG